MFIVCCISDLPPAFMHQLRLDRPFDFYSYITIKLIFVIILIFMVARAIIEARRDGS